MLNRINIEKKNLINNDHLEENIISTSSKNAADQLVIPGVEININTQSRNRGMEEKSFLLEDDFSEDLELLPEKDIEAEKQLSSLEIDTKKAFASRDLFDENDQNEEAHFMLPKTEVVTLTDRKWAREDKEPSEVDKAIHTTGTELYKKADFARRLKGRINDQKKKYAAARAGLSRNIQNCMSFDDLRDISYFFSDNDIANENLVCLASGRMRFENNKIKKAPTVMGRQMYKPVLDIMTGQIMDISLDRIDLSSDEAILERAGFFNELSQKLRVYKSYLDRSPRYLEALKEKNNRNYRILMRQLDALGAVDDYYRARTDVLMHPVYLRNYNREIGAIYDDRQSFQEKEFSKLLICMRTASKRLYLVFGKNFEGRRYPDLADAAGQSSEYMSQFKAFYAKQESLTKTDPVTGKIKIRWHESRDIYNFQRRERQLRRAGFSGKGGIDVSEINRDNLESLEKKLSDFLKDHPGLKKEDILNDNQAFEEALPDASKELRELFGMYIVLHNPHQTMRSVDMLKSHGAYSDDELRDLVEDYQKLFSQGEQAHSEDEMNRRLASAGTLIMMHYDLAYRFFATYGNKLYEHSEPEILAGLIKTGKGQLFMQRLRCVGQLSVLAQRTVNIDGENKNILDVLVQKNLIDANYLKDIRDTAKLLDCYRSIHTGGVDSLVNKAVENKARDENAAKEKMSDERYEELRSLTNGQGGLELVYRNDFDRAVGVFLQGSDKRSDDFKAVKRALRKLTGTYTGHGEGREPVSLMQLVTRGKVEPGSEVFPAFLKLYNALSNYIAVHINNHFQMGSIREATTLLMHLGRVTRIASGKRLCESIAEPTGVTKDEKEFAKNKLEAFAENYFRYSKAVGQDLVASDSEKLTRRWDVLKKVERDIQIMNSFYRKDINKSVKLLLFMQEYITVKMNMSLLKNAVDGEGNKEELSNKRSQFIKERTEHFSEKKVIERSDAYSEDGISARQLFELRRIDQWLIRNVRNGGYFGFIKGNTDRSDIVSTIMKKSARERLYIYYAVENSQARKNPDPTDAIKSQFYMPDIDRFKGAMISHKLKFYKRFSGGGYIYWHKLSQALTLSEGNSVILDNLDGLIQKEKTAAEERHENTRLVEKEVDGFQIVDDYMDRLAKTISTLIEIRMLKEQFEAGHLEAADYERKSNELNEKMIEHYKIFTRIPDVTGIVFDNPNAIKLDADPHDQPRGERVKDAIQFVGGHMSYFSKFEKIGEAILSFNHLKGGFFRFMETYGSGSEKGFSLIGNAIGIGFSMYSLLKNWKTTRNMDRMVSISGMAVNTGKIVRVSGKIAAAAGSTTETVGALVGNTAGVVLAGADTAIAVVKGWSHYKNGSKRKLASQIATRISQNEQQEGVVADTRYREGMVRLNRFLGKRQKIDTGSSFLGASSGVTLAVLGLGSVLSMGILSGIGAAVGLVTTIGSHVWTTRVAKQMRREIDAAFYQADEMMAKVREEWQQENGEPLSKKQEKRLREQILRRIAASLGYYSPSQMANSLANDYAEYLLNGAGEQGDQGAMCESMIKGLGIKVMKDPETGKIVSPKASDIAKRMFG